MSNEVKLTLPADRKFLPLVLGAVTDYARALGVGDPELDEIRLALEEAVTNVIEHGYSGGRSEAFHIELSAESGGLMFLIKERGLPFDPEALERDAGGPGTPDDPTRGLGLRILRRYMDEVGFRSLGMEGKETRLVKRICPGCVLEDEPAPLPEISPLPDDMPFEVRRMRLNEALEVARLAYHAYGYTYSKLQIYDPAVIRTMNNNGTLASYVAVTPGGEIMGHAALIHHDDLPQVPELGVAFVKPRFRRRGCMTRLTDWLLEEARQRKVHGVFAHGVCSHDYSQRALAGYGLAPCVLRLGCAPHREYKDIKSSPARESFLTCHRYVAPRPAKPLFFPERHAAMLGRIYAWQKRLVSENVASTGLALPERPPMLQFNLVSKSTALMRVKRFGLGLVPEVRLRLKQACLERVDNIFLEMDLSNPLTASLTPEFEGLGFFFAGVMPTGGGQDRLVLQYLNNVAVDFDDLRAGSDEGRELMDYVRDCMAEQG